MKHNVVRVWLHEYSQLRRLLTTILIPVLLFVALVYLLVTPGTVNAAVTDVEVTIIAAPNLIVDSNVLSPSTQAPEVATVIGRFCNTSNTTLNNIVGYIGDYDSGTPSNSIPGIYPSKTNVTIGGQLYSGTYRFLHLGGRADAIRIIGTLNPGQCSYQYWSFQYPKTANGGTIATWGSDVKPTDDLFLDFDIWAAEAGTICNSAICNENHVMTMRNEISAMANKIEPNGNPGGQWFNTNDETVNVGETITTNGILYRIGNVNQGFDNDGDLVPDYNAWLQPIGNPTYDPSCFRLIEASGILTVTRSAGNPDLVIPFSHSLNQQNDAPLLYFTDLPTDNTDVRGLVYYTFMALGGPCTIPISPYQEVASGSDNEKFNGDYGGGGPGTINTYPPSLDFDKNGPASTIEGSAAFTYSIPFQNTGSSSMGLSLSSGLNAGFVISDTVPDGLQYVGGSAAANNIVPPGNSFIIYYSTNSGLTWTTTPPGTTTSTAPNNLVQIQWWLTQPLQASQSGTVTFQAQVPNGYITGGGDPFIENCADARLGTGSPLAEACAITMVQGNNALGDTVWSDNGAGGGISNNGVQDGTEAGIADVTVTLYWDRDGDGQLDPTDPQVGITTSNGTGIYGFSNLPDARYIVVVDTTDTNLPTGYGPTTPQQYAIDLDSAGASGTGITNNTADFGFGPVLTLTKDLTTPDPAYVGETVEYRITLNNNLPGDGTANGYCQYTVWSPTQDIAHSGSGVSAWTNPANAFNSLGPDIVYAFSNYSNNVNSIAATNFNLGSQASNITKVEAIFRIYVAGTLVDDTATAYLYFNDAQQSTLGFLSATLNSFGPTQAGVGNLIWDVTPARAWTFSDFTGTQIDLQFDTTKNAGVDGASLYLDGMALRITTAQQCNGAATTITELPLTDTYDATYLQFVSANPPASSQTPGTITWNNLGPLYAGGSKSVIVTFRALATVAPTVNTATSTNGKFGTGRTVNSASDTANVTINAPGSIAGTIWAESNAANQWTNPTGYDGADSRIPGVTVQLYGCFGNFNGVYQLLTPTTAPVTNRECTHANVGGTWVLLTTQQTANDGSYTFTGLRPGYYNVKVLESTLPAGLTTRTGDPDPAANGVGTACGTCDGQWNTDAATLNTINDVTSGESITVVSFGYRDPDSQGAIIGYVWNDRDSDGVWDSNEEPIPNTSVYLCTTTPCTSATPGAVLTTTDSNGRYSYGNLAAGTYYVGVTTPSDMSQSGDPDVPGTNCGGSCNNQTNAITLAARQVSSPYNFGYTGGLTIGDTIYADWNGNGSQNTGEEGISGVQVRLYRDLNGNGVVDSGDTLLDTQTTNASGFYQFTNLAGNGNQYLVQVVTTTLPSGYNQTGDPDQPGITCTTCDNKQVVTLTTTSVNTSDFGYQPTGFASIGDYIWNDLDGDGNQDATEPAINNVTVHLYQDQDGDGVIDPEDALVATTTTAGGGLYTFTNLYPSNYIVAIEPTEFNTGGDLAGLTLTSTGAAYTNMAGQVSYEVALGAGQVFTDADFGFAQGIIGDLIWRDNNGNGTPDPGEPGISGVTVTLYNDVNGNGVYDAGTDTLRATTTTNGSGLYQFGSLPGGDYVVVVTPPINYTLTGDPDAYSTNPGISTYPPCSTTNPDYLFCDHQYGVNLRAGQVDRTADFGYQPRGVIGDTLWVDGNGDGVRNNGESGIGFITVYLCASSPCNSVTALQSTSTDSDGYYSFGNLADGSYVVAVDTGDTDFPTGLTLTYDPDETNPCTICNNEGSTTITAGSVDLTRDFGYRYAGNNTITGTIWHDDDSGGATNGTGDIDAGETYRYGNVTVYLWNCGAGTCNDGDEALAGTTTTNGTGQYNFTNLANGTYAVTVNPNSPSLAGATPTTPTGYIGGSDPNVVLSGGTNAQRDFGFLSTMDFGDLPSFYNNTLSAENGARHLMGTVYLGTAVEADPDGQENAAATGDTDEGIAVTSTWTNGANGGAVTVTAQCPTSPCYLSAWVDWNADGDFNDSGERIFLDQTVNNGLNALTFNIPSGTFSPSGPSLVLNARFRIYAASTGGFAQPTGYVVNGEVEDYQWQFGPTAIGLITWQAVYSNPAAAIIIAFTLLLLTTSIILYRQVALNRRKR